MSYFFHENKDVELFRSLALTIDENPAAIHNYISAPIFESLCSDQTSTCVQRTQLIETLSYGDAGVALAAPGASLAGLIIRELGNEKQKERFFSYLKKHVCSTFLAVTEPNKGSDAANMETRLSGWDADHYQLSGVKCFVGHAADASLGVLMARRSAGPLGLCAILLTDDELNQPQVQRIPLDMLGLRGARLGKLILNRAIIPKENILGQHLHPIKAGLMGMIKTFNRMRPVVAAFALGHAAAVLDYAEKNKEDFLKKTHPRLREMNFEIKAMRALLYDCAQKADANPNDSAPASLAKLNATRLAEKITIEVMDYFGVNAILRHPLLMKWYRDVFGFEYMEGTSLMQLKNIYSAYSNRQVI